MKRARVLFLIVIITMLFSPLALAEDKGSVSEKPEKKGSSWWSEERAEAELSEAQRAKMKEQSRSKKEVKPGQGNAFGHGPKGR